MARDVKVAATKVWKVLHEVVAYNGSRITVTREVIDHIERKHPQMLSVAGLSAERLLSLMIQTIESPTEVYVDAHHTQYFLRKIDPLYFNVIVADGTVRTAYLMGERTHRRMGKTRWLHRLYST